MLIEPDRIGIVDRDERIEAGIAELDERVGEGLDDEFPCDPFPAAIRDDRDPAAGRGEAVEHDDTMQPVIRSNADRRRVVAKPDSATVRRPSQHLFGGAVDDFLQRIIRFWIAMATPLRRFEMSSMSF